MERFKVLQKFFIKGSYLATVGMELAYAEETGVLAVLHHGKKFPNISKKTVLDWVARKNLESEGKSATVASLNTPADESSLVESVTKPVENVVVPDNDTEIAELEAEASQIEVDKALKGVVKKNTPKDEFKAVVKEAKENA